MEAIIARIKGYVLILYPNILSDLGVADAFLDFIVNEVVDRALAYTNRYQLVSGYTDFLEGEYYEGNTTYDYDGNEVPILPIPTEIERALARVVVSACRSAISTRDSNGAIKRLKDNGQEVEYSEYINSYLVSSDDAKIFSGITELLDKFRIPTIVDNSSRL